MTLQGRLSATSFWGPGFDQIRLIAAVIVLLHHSWLVQQVLSDDLLFRYSGGFIHFGFLAVAIFFAISGFLVTPGLIKSGSISQYAVNRTVRIFPALAVVVAGTAFCLGPVLTSVSPRTYFTDPHLYLYLKNAVTLTYNYLPGISSDTGRPLVVNGALWTLHFEVLSYSALAIMSLVGCCWFPGVVVCSYLVSYVINAAITLGAPAPMVLPGRLATFLSLFVYFSAGCTVYLLRDHIPYSKSLAFMAAGIAVMSLPSQLPAFVLPVCLPYVIIVIGLSAVPGRAVVKRDLSYGVYLIHGPVIVSISIIVPWVTTWSHISILALLITVMLSFILREFIEAPLLAHKKMMHNWIVVRLSRLSHNLLLRQVAANTPQQSTVSTRSTRYKKGESNAT